MKYLFITLLGVGLFNGCTSGSTESEVVTADSTTVDTVKVDSTVVVDSVKTDSIK
jgi:hypothetical protein